MAERMILDQLESLQEDIVMLQRRREEAEVVRAAGGGGDIEALDAEIARTERLASSLMRSLTALREAQARVDAAAGRRARVGPAEAAGRRRASGAGAGAGAGAAAAVRGEKRGRDDDEEDDSLRFAKRVAIRYPSRKVTRYTTSDVVSRQAEYERVFDKYIVEESVRNFLLERVGRSFVEQFNWVITTLDDMMRRNAQQASEEDMEKIGSTLAYVFVMQRAVLHDNQVDGESISQEHFLALVNQLRTANPTYQFVTLRSRSRDYFEEAIRALRRGETAEEAANFLLLG